MRKWRPPRRLRSFQPGSQPPAWPPPALGKVSLGELRSALDLAEQPDHDEHRLLGDKDRVLGDALQATRDEDHQHRPLANLKIATDLERAVEALAVEPVDLPVTANEVPSHRDVASVKRLF